MAVKRAQEADYIIVPTSDNQNIHENGQENTGDSQGVKKYRRRTERMEQQYKSGFAALVGRPNVGKSTLMNRLIGQKIAITSSKPQTTRNRIQTVYTSEAGQIVFLDTPGIHRAKNKLGSYMVNVAERTLEDVDVVLWLVERFHVYRRGRAAYYSGTETAQHTGHTGDQ